MKTLSDLFAALLGLFERPAPSASPTRTSDAALPTKPAAAPSSPPAASIVAPPEVVAPTPPAISWLTLCRPITQHFESCRLTAYWDTGGKVWTCGWGTTGPDVTEGTVWTQAHADAQLEIRLNEAADIVDTAVRVPITPAQKGALTDLVYNVGAGRAARAGDPGRDGIVTLANGQPSTLLRHLNAGDYAGCAAQIGAWDRSGGEVQNGLIARRAAEHTLFLTGAWKP